MRTILCVLILSLTVSAAPLGLYSSNPQLAEGLASAGLEVQLVSDLSTFQGTLLLTDSPDLTTDQAQALVDWDGGQIIAMGRIGSDPAIWEILQPLLGAKVLGWMVAQDGHFFLTATIEAPWDKLPVFINQKGTGALVLRPLAESTVWATWSNSDGVTPTHLPGINASVIKHSRGVTIGGALLEGRSLSDPTIRSLLEQIIASL